ncbi:cbb3-type cytochrome c oxidase subunit I [Brevibacillus sp. SYSU BS000544]|uniref:cbb3-type cytochrome c oxidase subunit I n=1 Tax=Brevibacillus sp. SYSU BS000544 TaxID=3416443 RepID=UPI003CE5660D
MFSNAPDSAAKHFWYSSVLWLIISMLAGLVVALKQMWPDFLGGTTFLTYGHVRPIHTNGVLFAWLTTNFIGGMYYMIPRLCRVPLHSEKLGHITGILWNLIIVLAVVTLSMGITTGVEYAELVLPIDLLIAVTVILVAVNVFMTIAKRQEKLLYVSIWYTVGSLVWLPLLYIVGNIPSELVGGAAQANMNWFYGHNALGLWFTTLGIAQIYYLLPKLTGKPLYSHKLSLIGFWTIATFYVWNGPHHLVNGPIPLWLMKAGIIPSILLIIPVWTVVANIFGTIKGNWGKMKNDIALKFIATASIFYVLTCLQGPFQSLMAVSAVVKFTHWVAGHAHMAPFATFSFVGFAFMYYAIPRMTGRQLYSKAFCEWHYYLSVIGFLTFAFSLWTAGLIQGFGWINGTPFMETVNEVKTLLVIRAIGGTMMIAGQFFFAANLWLTVKKGTPVSKSNTVAA